MGSAFAWLDHSEFDRGKALDVVHLFRQQGTLDELGIGTIRDAFADRFFPGTSTIQTRARYFLFIPWIYRRLEDRKVASSKIAAAARSAEIGLIQRLLDMGEAEGVIGRDAGRGLKRLPSAIYWAGLHTWGIRTFPGSQDQYHRSLDRYYQQERLLRTDDGDLIVGAQRGNWHHNLPEALEGFPEGATLALTRVEASYLAERIQAQLPGSLLAHLVTTSDLIESTFPWEQPAVASWTSASEIEHARNFSEVIHGASLLYNLLLSEAAGRSDWIDDYRNLLDKWVRLMDARADRIGAWDLDAFWRLVRIANPRTPSLTQAFADRWLRRAIETPAAVADDPQMRAAIREREWQLKRGRARLHNSNALGLWTGASGTVQLDYRWRITSALINDILKGLANDA